MISKIKQERFIIELTSTSNGTIEVFIILLENGDEVDCYFGMGKTPKKAFNEALKYYETTKEAILAESPKTDGIKISKGCNRRSIEYVIGKFRIIAVIRDSNTHVMIRENGRDRFSISGTGLTKSKAFKKARRQYDKILKHMRGIGNE